MTEALTWLAMSLRVIFASLFQNSVSDNKSVIMKFVNRNDLETLFYQKKLISNRGFSNISIPRNIFFFCANISLLPIYLG